MGFAKKRAMGRWKTLARRSIRATRVAVKTAANWIVVSRGVYLGVFLSLTGSESIVLAGLNRKQCLRISLLK